jgi:azurin
MYTQSLATLLIASALVAAPALAQTTATQKPATPSTQKPATGTTKPAAKGVRTVEIIGTDDMKFSLNTIEAKPGEQLRIRLMTKSAMPKIAMAHNWVLLKKDAPLIKFITAGTAHRDTDFVAPEMKDQVLAKTDLAGGGETVEVVLKVPAAAGDYPYVCTFPGHFQAGMRGMLVVK